MSKFGSLCHPHSRAWNFLSNHYKQVVRPLKAIAALAENRVIGDQGRIPWHLPSDFRWFKQNTLGQTLVMGRKTFESIGRPLPGRRTIVLSRGSPIYPNVTVVRDLDELALAVEDDPREVWVAGGAAIYAQLLPWCTDLFLSWVHRTATGNAVFPAFEDQFVRIAEVLHEPEFTVVHYQNRNRLLA